MKYTDQNPPLKCYMTQSVWGQNATRNGTPIGVLWHDTGAGNPYIKRYVQPDDTDPNRDELISIIGENKNHNDWNHTSRQAGVNFFVGKLADGTVSTVQTNDLDVHPWGCGGGTKGTCNGAVKVGSKYIDTKEFWLQFEICDDGYGDKNYFNLIFEEACQLTAYLCKKFNIDPKGSLLFAGVTAPTILCHNDSYKIKLGSNHADIYTWFNKYGKTMDDVKNRVAELLAEDEPKEYYRIRLSANDSKSQKGAYSTADAAINACHDYPGYSVFDPDFNCIYTEPLVIPEPTEPEPIKPEPIEDPITTPDPIEIPEPDPVINDPIDTTEPTKPEPSNPPQNNEKPKKDFISIIIDFLKSLFSR